MKQHLYAHLCTFAVAGLAIGAQQAQAQSPSPAAHKAVKKTASKKAGAEKEPDISKASSVEFNCELGNKLTIYHNAGDDQHLALRWKQKVHELSRVDTSTGANRFENSKSGLVWIDLPSKGMLLDSRKGQQLANECRSAEHAEK